MELSPEGRDRLKAAARALHLTHRDLAGIAGYRTHTHIGKLLRGKKKGLEPKAAIRIARHFNVPVEHFFLLRTSDDARRVVEQNTAA